MTAFKPAPGVGMFVGRLPKSSYGNQVIYIVGRIEVIEVQSPPVGRHSNSGWREYLPGITDASIELHDVKIAITAEEAERMMNEPGTLPSTPKALSPGQPS